MSRVVTPPTSQTPPYTPAQGAMPQTRIPHEKIAMRAYEKWTQHGRPCGTELQDWLEAEAELRAEFTRTSFAGSSQPRR
jgi:hypothetical protein